MKHLLSSGLTLVLMLGLTDSVLAAEADKDFFQAIGKMYVVVAIILIIFIGLSLYLWKLDQKLSRLEKMKDNE